MGAQALRWSWCRILFPATMPIVAAASVSAQTARTDTSTTAFDVGHVHVILRQNTANEVVAANVYLVGGTQQLTPQNAGVEVLMLAASEDGTRKFSKETLRRITARTGATIVIRPGVDWTEFGVRALRQSFDSSWAVLADRLVQPRLDSIDVDRARQQMLTNALQADADPDAAVTHLAEGLLYAGHAYRLDPEGTPTSLRALTVEDVRRYHDNQVVQSRILVVVVGNVSREQLECAVSSTLARLPMGSYVWAPPRDLTPAAERLKKLSRSLPTNYILGYYPGPRAGTRDYDALRIATAVLSGRLFAEVRSREHLTYAVEAPFLERAISSGGLYVTTTDPAAALEAMEQEVRRLQTTLVDPVGLRMLVRGFITDYFLKNETDADQASFLAREQLYEGDYRKAGDFMERLREITPDDVQRVAQIYMHGMKFGFVGDTTKIPVSLGLQF